MPYTVKWWAPCWDLLFFFIQWVIQCESEGIRKPSSSMNRVTFRIIRYWCTVDNNREPWNERWTGNSLLHSIIHHSSASTVVAGADLEWAHRGPCDLIGPLVPPPPILSVDLRWTPKLTPTKCEIYDKSNPPVRVALKRTIATPHCDVSLSFVPLPPLK